MTIYLQTTTALHYNLSVERNLLCFLQISTGYSEFVSQVYAASDYCFLYHLGIRPFVLLFFSYAIQKARSTQQFGDHTQSTHLNRCCVYLYYIILVLVTASNNKTFSHAISLFSLLHVAPCTSANPTSSTNTKNKRRGGWPSDPAHSPSLTLHSPPLPVSPHLIRAWS